MERIMLPLVAASFCVSVLALLALRPIAIAVGLTDRPGGHKTHHGDVPIVGGLAMFIAIALGVGLVPLPGPIGGAYLAACAILVTMGLIDDRFNLSPWTRLPGQAVAALVLITGSNVVVTSLGDPFGAGPIHLSGYLSIGFTLLVFIAAINAFNMLDGLDGLAGSVAVISLLAIAYISWTPRLAIALPISLVLIGAISGFLVFNVPIRINRGLSCFMGDAGSTLLGLSVVWLCIQISEGPRKEVSPVTLLWVVALPLYELAWSTVRRIVRGVSPFRADTNHFHHLLLRAGFSVRAAFLAFVSLTTIFAGIGLILEQYHVSDRISFCLLMVCGAATIRMMYRANLIWLVVPESLTRFALRMPQAAASAHVNGVLNGDKFNGLDAAVMRRPTTGAQHHSASSTPNPPP